MIALLLVAALAAAPAPRPGADITIDRPTRGPVVSVAGTIHVISLVEGDVVALGGDVELGPDCKVDGDVVAVGGAITGPGRVSGRVVSLASLSGVAGGRGSTAARWGLALVRVGGWMLLATVVVLVGPRAVRHAAGELARLPWRVSLVGVGALLVWTVVMAAVMLLAGGPLGVVLVLGGVAAFLLAKVVGVAVMAWLGGRWLARALPPALRGEVPRTGIAMGLLAMIGFVPALGAPLWVVANLVGIGAAITTVVAPDALRVLFVRAVSR